ncbi:MAG: Gx transporter family protein [Clostridiales bacterium]|nr:Gx transporter family protein [Clostridiales bacterium]
MKTRTIAIYGMLIALALLLSYVEAQLPAFFAVPGVKLGLTNIVVVCALYMLGKGAAIGVNLLRVLLVGLMFGNGMSLAYSAAGALLSGLTMIVLQKKFHTVTVSVAGGLMHNIGQILVAMLVLETTRIAWYLAVLWFSGMAAGTVIGLIGFELVRRLGPVVRQWKEGAPL